MSIQDVYEYKQTEFQDLTKVSQAISGTSIVPFVYEGIKIAGYNINLFDDAVGTTQLVLDTDYTLQNMDTKVSTAESVDVYGGYQVINAAYQGVNLFLDIRCVGGYTKYTGGKYEVVTGTDTITPESFGYSVYVDNGATPVTITINDANRIDDKLSIFALGSAEVTLTGSGISQAITGSMLSFTWGGSQYETAGNAVGYYETIYKIDDAVTPTGNSPVGWTSTPPTRVADEIIYASTGFRNENDILSGVWSTPTQWSGDDGDQGIQGIQGEQGIQGFGIPTGGAVNDLLVKNTTTDYDVSFKSGTSSGIDVDLLDGEHGAYYEQFISTTTTNMALAPDNAFWTANKSYVSSTTDAATDFGITGETAGIVVCYYVSEISSTQIFYEKLGTKSFTRGGNNTVWSSWVEQYSSGNPPPTAAPPIGFIYIQLPGKDTPSTLWSGTWTNVSSTYAGNFFRAEGGDASTFASGKQDDQFQGHRHQQIAAATTGGNGQNAGSAGSTLITSVLDPITDGTNGTVRTGSETRPVNETVRIWERTA